jgi:hypothetical protein
LPNILAKAKFVSVALIFKAGEPPLPLAVTEEEKVAAPVALAICNTEVLVPATNLDKYKSPVATPSKSKSKPKLGFASSYIPILGEPGAATPVVAHIVNLLVSVVPLPIMTFPFSVIRIL